MRIPGYQIERELGQGGMAIVYLATQESLHRHVALKVIKPVLTTDEEFAQRFLREGRIIAQLSDPHIVTVYDIASHEGTYYLSMEYLAGGTLQQRIREGLSLSEALIVARAIAIALHYAHGRGIVHRDIKPQNILFRENGTPVLTDFGIAKTLGSSTIMTRTGLSIGTPRYMSPEQIRGQGADARTDLYSFGVLFYEMLTGNVPYLAEDSFALAMMHVTAPIPELPPALSRFQPLLLRLLEKDPSLRFQSGKDFIAALDNLEAGRFDLLGVTKPSQPIIDSAPAATPRRFGRKTGALAAAVALAGAAGGYLYLHRMTPPPIEPTPTPVATSTTPPTVDTAAQRRAEAEQLLVQARRQQQAGALEDSLAHIEQALRLAPGHPALLSLREEVTRRIDDAKARAAQAAQQRQQAELQAEQFFEQAQRARQDGQFDASLIHIEQGLQAMPEHPGLLAMKRDVMTQRAERQHQEEAARKQAAVAERQKAEVERQRKAEEFLARALDDQRNRAYESSLLQIEEGLRQVPDHRRLLTLRETVRKQLREAKAAPAPAPTPTPTPPADTASRVAALLKECGAHLRANRLVTGRGGNAADCYGEVLKLDRDNAEARAGRDQIADKYADLVASALQSGDAKRAKGLLSRVESLNPGNTRLPGLREQLARAETSAEPTRSAPPQEPRKPEPTAPPPINLVSIPQSSEQPPDTPVSKTQVIAEDRHGRLTKTETDDNISLQLTTSPQGAADSAGRKTVKQPQKDLPAQLFVRSDVDDADIWINGRKVGTAPMQIEMRPGSYRVRVSREGYADWNGKVDLAPGDESSLMAMLPRKLEVAAAPPPTPAPEPPQPRAPEPRTAVKTAPASGCVSGNCENGQGAYHYPDGSEYSGEFRNAKMHGQGTYVYTGRGEKYVGEWRNGQKNGQGVYHYRSGNRYEGEWRNDRQSGQGTYYYAERGEKYVGDFANGQPNGQGVYHYSNGDRYEGEWRNGQKNGQGVLYEGGQKIVGEWQNDQKVRVRVER